MKKSIELLTKGKGRFKVGIDSINIGNKLNITLFNPNINYMFSTNNIVSKSKNCIFIDQKLKGIVYGVMANNQIHLNH